MTGWRLLMLGLGSILMWSVDQPRAAEGFDTPRSASGPCLVLSSYEVSTSDAAAGERLFRANATVENICGRTLEVAFCFLYAEPTDSVDRSCYSAVVRPWSRAQAAAPSAATRIVGTDYQWRFLTEGLGS